MGNDREDRLDGDSLMGCVSSGRANWEVCQILPVWVKLMFLGLHGGDRGKISGMQVRLVGLLCLQSACMSTITSAVVSQCNDVLLGQEYGSALILFKSDMMQCGSS